MHNDQKIEVMRHSAAHVLASAVQKLWPSAKFGVGPVVENGFYYDIDLGKNSISEDDMHKIEIEMTKIVQAKQKFEKYNKSIDEAIRWAKTSEQPYKEELLNDLKRSGTTAAKDIDNRELGLPSTIGSKVKEVSFYRNGEFTDLCRGPHVDNTSEIGSFKLTKVSGAYWRGKEANTQMQRIYGVAFNTKKELEQYLELIERAKEIDHRKLGKDLDLFVFSNLVGSGLPMFTPRGTILREELRKYSEELRENIGYQRVWTPHIAKQELYEVSGHWSKFGDEWLTVTSKESKDKLVMKPMNCPHHQQIYASRQRSYRELPLKYMETTTDYRDEKAGELLGLSRVRSLTQDDSHTFCTPEQVNGVINSLVTVVKQFYEALDMPLRVRLSVRDDSDQYLGDKGLWENAEHILEEVIKDNKLDYFKAEGEAAFYGPKIDFLAKDSLGRVLQVATPQLDFIQPERFGLKYVDEDGKEKTPILVHFALMGSIERFLSAYIEHVGGKFPIWLAPEQVRLLTVNQDIETIKLAQEISSLAKENNIRLNIDDSNQSVSKKIRLAEVMKVPFVIVIGDKEISSRKVIPRIRSDLGSCKKDSYRIEDFITELANEAKKRLLVNSL